MTLSRVISIENDYSDEPFVMLKESMLMPADVLWRGKSRPRFSHLTEMIAGPQSQSER